MKISIITATYNRADTIRSTVESILSQTYVDWEHIVIDGASSDNTLDVLKEYAGRYNGRLKILSEPDCGIYDAMNKGIAIATGDVIGFLNSDDFYFDSSVLDNISKEFDDKNTDAVYAGAVAVKSSDTSRIIRIKRGSKYPKNGFYEGWHPAHPTFYAKKECYDRFGNFDLSFGTAADLELMMRFIEVHHITTRYVPKLFVKMRFGGASNNSLSSLLKANSLVLRAFDKNGLRRPKFYFLRKIGPKFINMVRVRLGLDSL